MPPYTTRKIRKWHRAVATVVGLQLLVWLVSGFYFNITPQLQLKGLTYFTKNIASHNRQSLAEFTLVDPKHLLDLYPKTLNIELLQLHGQPYYRLTDKITRYPHECQQQVLINTQTGTKQTIGKTLAIQLASQSYTGSGDVLTAEKMKGKISEWPKQCNELWRIDYHDDLNTRIYLDAGNGNIIGHKNDHTDIADWMFRLHFMDYLNQGSFNNPFAWLFAFIALTLTVSGILSIYDNAKHNRYKRTVN